MPIEREAGHLGSISPLAVLTYFRLRHKSWLPSWPAALTVLQRGGNKLESASPALSGSSVMEKNQEKTGKARPRLWPPFFAWVLSNEPTQKTLSNCGLRLPRVIHWERLLPYSRPTPRKCYGTVPRTRHFAGNDLFKHR